jgi:hypothetical protein
MHHATVTFSIDPTVPVGVRIHPDGIATYLSEIYGPQLVCDHFRSDAHTPEALVVWLRATADAVERAWAERRTAEQHEPLVSAEDLDVDQIVTWLA